VGRSRGSLAVVAACVLALGAAGVAEASRAATLAVKVPPSASVHFNALYVITLSGFAGAYDRVMVLNFSPGPTRCPTAQTVLRILHPERANVKPGHAFSRSFGFRGPPPQEVTTCAYLYRSSNGTGISVTKNWMAG